MTMKNFDLIILAFFLFLAPIISLTFETNLLTSIFLFYTLPAIYLSYRIPQYIVRAASFALISTFLFFMIDYVAVSDGGWWVSTIFDYRFLGILPIEDSIWFFMAVYLMVLFYEHFDDRGLYQVKNNRMKYLTGIVAAMVVLFIALVYFSPQFLIINYAYLWIGIIFFIIPTIIILTIYPKLRFKFLRTNLYIFCLHLPFEIVALKLGQWGFPGNNFIGWIEIADVRFPMEELVTYILMTGITGLAYYEFFDDDRR